MTEKLHVRPADLQGISRLAVEGTIGLADLVEAMHSNITRAAARGGAPQAPALGIRSLVYGSIRAITQVVGSAIDSLLLQLIPLLGQQGSSLAREAILAAINGILGDYLVASANPLALPMQLRHDGQALELTRSALATAFSQPSGRILLLAHGLCMNDLHWRRNGHDHAALLASDHDYTPVYLHYNSGLHISTNGRAFAETIEALVQQWPVPVKQIAIVGHSMGGLVSRSACYYGTAGGHTWPRYLRKLVFLGTPHHGAPLERVGSWVQGILTASCYSAPIARVGNIRSAGITDLHYGNLLDVDWEGQNRFAQAGDRRQPVPLPGEVECYAIAATTGKAAGDLKDQLLGDGLVPLSSALGDHSQSSRALPFSKKWVGYDMNHLDLLERRDVYDQLQRWLAA